MTDVVLYATDTMADWEYGYLTAGLAWVERRRLPATGPRRRARPGDDEGAASGRRPTATSRDVDEDAVAMLVLPGADTWGSGHEAALALAGRLLGRGVPVAAICGATLGLARAGVLDERDHTSNAPDFLATSGLRAAPPATATPPSSRTAT